MSTFSWCGGPLLYITAAFAVTGELGDLFPTTEQHWDDVRAVVISPSCFLSWIIRGFT